MAEASQEGAGAAPQDPARDNEEHELEAEEESAAAMDAETAHGADASQATESQPGIAAPAEPEKRREP